LVTTVTILNGCNQIPSPEAWADGAIGLTLNQLYSPVSIKLIAKEYINKYGEKIIMIPEAPGCSTYYTLDAKDIVTSYKLVGEECR